MHEKQMLLLEPAYWIRSNIFELNQKSKTILLARQNETYQNIVMNTRDHKNLSVCPRAALAKL